MLSADTAPDELDHLTALLSELSAQLTANRQHCAALSRQAEDLKIQAAHAGSGFTLRRFNVDISLGPSASPVRTHTAQNSSSRSSNGSTRRS